MAVYETNYINYVKEALMDVVPMDEAIATTIATRFDRNLKVYGLKCFKELYDVARGELEYTIWLNYKEVPLEEFKTVIDNIMECVVNVLKRIYKGELDCPQYPVCYWQRIVHSDVRQCKKYILKGSYPYLKEVGMWSSYKVLVSDYDARERIRYPNPQVGIFEDPTATDELEAIDPEALPYKLPEVAIRVPDGLLTNIPLPMEAEPELIDIPKPCVLSALLALPSQYGIEQPHWTCSVCKLINGLETEVCGACGASMPNE